MSLPVHKILWAPTNNAHWNHLHVEGDPSQLGTPSLDYPGQTVSIQIIINALNKKFGNGVHYEHPDAKNAGWTHMGIYNRRFIAGTAIWSQHAYANAIDIGPYYGVSEQQVFYDFLKEVEMPPTQEEVLAALGLEVDDIRILRQLADAAQAHEMNVSVYPFFHELLDWSKNGLPAGSSMTAAQVRQIIVNALVNG